MNYLLEKFNKIVFGYATNEDIKEVQQALSDYFDLCKDIATFNKIVLTNEDFEKLSGKKIPRITFISGDKQ